jgi:hypothetical protein
MYGKKLLEGDIPRIASALEKIADALEKPEKEQFLITSHACKGKIRRILNTIKNSTAEDLQGVIYAIEKDELGDLTVKELDAMLDSYDPEWEADVKNGR